MRIEKRFPKKRLHMINEDIRSPEVRLIDEDKNQVGIVPIKQALEIAKERELDLVAISPDAKPPVCRLLEYGKYLYSLQKKEHEAKKNQRKIHVKEIKFTPVIGEHDIEVKMKRIAKFLEDGDKVKVTIWLKGRQKRKPELLDEMTEKILKILTEVSEIESPPKKERFVSYIMIGKKKGGKDAKTKNTHGSEKEV
jgi:translation initiation factor IF-3